MTHVKDARRPRRERRGPAHRSRDFGMYTGAERDHLNEQAALLVRLAVTDREACAARLGHRSRSALDDWCNGAPGNVVARFLPLYDACDNPDVILAHLQARRDARIREMDDDELLAERRDAEMAESSCDCAEDAESDRVRLGVGSESRLALLRIQHSAASARAALLASECGRRGLS